MPAGGVRVLGAGALLALGVNGIVGVGIFFAPAQVAALIPGALGVGVYAFTALGLLPIAAVYAALGSRYRADGGPYVWAREAFGPLAAFGVGWIAYVSAIFSTSTVVAGLARFLGPELGLEGPVGSRVFTVGSAVVLGAIVASGLRPAALVWTAITILKLVPLVVLAIVSVAVFGQSAIDAPSKIVDLRVTPTFGRAALVVLFALQGFEIVAVPAAKVRGDGRAVAGATVGALLGAAALYLLLHAGCVATLPGLATSSAPLVDLASARVGPTFARTVAVGTNISALGICFGMFAMTPRYLAALGSPDGLGGWLGAEDERGVPRPALAITIGLVLVLVTSGRLEQLFVLSSVSVLAQYAVSAAALMVLAARKERGLRLGHALLGLPAIAVIGFCGLGATLAELAVAGGVIALGAACLGVRRLTRRSEC